MLHKSAHSQSLSKDVSSTVDRAPNPTGVSFAAGMHLRNISYKVDGKQILKNVSLDVHPGKTLCLLGPSGCGKTTLLRIISGLLQQDAGSISIDHRILSDERTFVPPEKRGIGLVFQDFALFPHMTIRQNVEFGLTALSKADAKKAADSVLERVGLKDRAHQYPDVLSGGEQQRVALARALAPRPIVILMDEPFSGLDSRLRDDVRQHCLDLLRESRSTAIIVTHDAEEALRVGDHIALLRDGELVQYGSGQELYFNPVDHFAAGFFSEINTIPVSDDETCATTLFGKTVHSCQDTGIEASAALRQTDVTLKPFKKGGEGHPAHIVGRRFLGTSELIDFKVEGIPKALRARVKPGQIAENSTMVLVNVDPSSIMVFPQK